MTFLSDRDIRQAIQLGRILIDGGERPVHIGPAGMDLTLGPRIIAPTDTEPHVFGRSLVLPPSAFVLGETDERITLSAGYLGVLHGRSTWARCGVMVECAGVIEPGWDGVLTLELKNLTDHPVAIPRYARIAQLLIAPLSSWPEQTYHHGKYQGAGSVQAALPDPR